MPGIFLWVIGLAVVYAYYNLKGAGDVFAKIIELKETHGYLYSGISTAVFGGLIPFLYLWKTGKVPVGKTLAWGLFFVIYWTIRGIEVDAFYRLQSWLFGDEPTWQNVLVKVVVDQFVYCIIWSAPLTAMAYGWKDAGFSWQKFRPRINREMFFVEIPGVLLSIWIVWIPATAIIYSLPLALQVPLFNLVLCFFVLLVSALSPTDVEG